ncbi:beta-eliminating lyase-related protein [uncultured Tateyamaria sp.]|uniref:beta-eliminating lyase-related protein n=1 Tax=uncultured Tateyamaria sp. TaxID=455651 RepID=UPI00260EA82C|nr:beta-eliminating lyase-related protein [uncultured Tateyamaria sp.]
MVAFTPRSARKASPVLRYHEFGTLERYLEDNGASVPCVMTTVTNNAGGGQLVSFENIRGTAELARRFDKSFFIDGRRFAENVWFIKQREPDQTDRTIPDIVRDCFAFADGMTMSAKKDTF